MWSPRANQTLVSIVSLTIGWTSWRNLFCLEFPRGPVEGPGRQGLPKLNRVKGRLADSRVVNFVSPNRRHFFAGRLSVFR